LSLEIVATEKDDAGGEQGIKRSARAGRDADRSWCPKKRRAGAATRRPRRGLPTPRYRAVRRARSARPYSRIPMRSTDRDERDVDHTVPPITGTACSAIGPPAEKVHNRKADQRQHQQDRAADDRDRQIALRSVSRISPWAARLRWPPAADRMPADDRAQDLETASRWPRQPIVAPRPTKRTLLRENVGDHRIGRAPEYCAPEPRHQPDPGDQHAEEHRRADRQPDQMGRRRSTPIEKLVETHRWPLGPIRKFLAAVRRRPTLSVASNWKKGPRSANRSR